MKRLLCVLLAFCLILYAFTATAGPFRVFAPGPCAGGMCEVPVQAVVNAPDQTVKKPDQTRKPDQVAKVPTVPPSLPSLKTTKPPVSAVPSVKSERRFGGAIVTKVKSVFRRR